MQPVLPFFGLKISLWSKNMKFYLFSLFMLGMVCLTGCTYSITMVHTEGTATDVVDETATNTPSTSITPTVSIPATAL
jgi:ABC-type lipoprotein release transport system permease subunit